MIPFQGLLRTPARSSPHLQNVADVDAKADVDAAAAAHLATATPLDELDDAASYRPTMAVWNNPPSQISSLTEPLLPLAESELEMQELPAD